MRPVPAWVKTKGFSNWNDYMASIRPVHGKKRRLRNPYLSISSKQTKCPVCRQLCSPGEKYHPGCKPPRYLKSVKKNPIAVYNPEMRPRIQVSRKSRRGKLRLRSPLKGYRINPRSRRSILSGIPPGKAKPLPMKNVEIRYQRAYGEYTGEWFRHTFKDSVEIIGLPDGSILIRSKSGKKLWGTV